MYAPCVKKEKTTQKTKVIKSEQQAKDRRLEHKNKEPKVKTTTKNNIACSLWYRFCCFFRFTVRSFYVLSALCKSCVSLLAPMSAVGNTILYNLAGVGPYLLFMGFCSASDQT